MDESKENISKESFELVFNQHYPAVYRYIFKRVLNIQLAEDIAMDVFAICWENIESFDPTKASFQTWLYTITNNKLKNYYRSKKEFSELDEKFAVEDFSYDIDSASRLDYLRNHLAKALDELSETQRKIVIYKHFKGKNSNDIALLLGMTPSNVRVQLKRGIDNLKKYFIKENIRWE